MELVILLVLITPFILALGLGSILFVRPDGLRPSWWDWGMDDPDPKKKNSSDEKPK